MGEITFRQHFNNISDAYSYAKTTKVDPLARESDIELNERLYILQAASKQYNAIIDLIGGDLRSPEINTDNSPELYKFLDMIESLDADFIPSSFNIFEPQINAQTTIDDALSISLLSKYFSVCDMLASTDNQRPPAQENIFGIESAPAAPTMKNRLLPPSGLLYVDITDAYQTALQGRSNTLPAQIDLLYYIQNTSQHIDNLTSKNITECFNLLYNQTDPGQIPIGLLLLIRGYYSEKMDQTFPARIPGDLNLSKLESMLNLVVSRIKELILNEHIDMTADDSGTVAQIGAQTQANLSALETLSGNVDRLHGYADIYNERVLSPNNVYGKNLIINMSGEIISRINTLAELEITAAGEAISAGDTLSAYTHYKNASAYLDANAIRNWGMSDDLAKSVIDGTSANHSAVSAALSDLDAKVAKVKTALDSKDVTTMIDALDNNPYTKLYIALNDTSEEALVAQTIDAMKDPACVLVILNSAAFTRTAPDKESPNSVKLVKRAEAIVRSLGLGGEVAILRLLKDNLTEARARDRLPTDGLLRTLDSLTAYSDRVQYTERQEPAEIIQQTAIEGEPTPPRPASTSETHYDIPITDLGKYASVSSLNVGDDTSNVSLNTPDGAMSLYDAITFGYYDPALGVNKYSQFSDKNKQTIAFLFNNNIYFVDSSGAVTAVIPNNNDMFKITTDSNGKTTITFKKGDPRLTDSGEKIYFIADVDVTINAPSATPDPGTAYVLNVTDTNSASIITADGTKTDLTITADKITLTPDDIKALYYSGGLLVLTGDNGSSSLNFLDVVGENNYTHPGNNAVDAYLQSVNFDTNNAHSVLNSDYAPSAKVTGLPASTAAARVNWSGETIDLPPLESFSGAFLNHNGTIYGQGTITAVIQVVKEDGSTESRTISIELPKYPPIFDAIAEGLPTNTDIDFYHYNYGIFTREAFKNYNEGKALEEKLNYITFQTGRGMDGLRLSYKRRLSDGTLTRTSSTKYLMFNNEILNRAMQLIAGENGEIGFGEEDLTALLPLFELLRKYPDGSIPADKTELIKFVRNEYGVELLESDMSSLYAAALKISTVIIPDEKNTYLISSSDLASGNGLHLGVTPGASYDSLDEGLGKLELYTKLHLNWKTDYNELAVEVKYTLLTALGADEDSFADYSQSRFSYKATDTFGTPEFQGFVSVLGDFNVTHNDELNNSYFAFLGGVQGRFVQPGYTPGNSRANSFYYLLSGGLQFTFLENYGIQALAPTLIGLLGYDFSHFSLETGGTALFHANGGLDPEKSPYAIRNDGDKDANISSLYFALRGENIWGNPYFATEKGNRLSFPFELKLDAATGEIMPSLGLNFNNRDEDSISWGLNLSAKFRIWDPFFAERQSGFDADVSLSPYMTLPNDTRIFADFGLRNMANDRKFSLGLGVYIPLN
jgi:hypothetical protein